MIHETPPTGLVLSALAAAALIVLALFLLRRAKSVEGYFVAHARIPWFVNGLALAGDFLSAASLLGICGTIAFFGYDGFFFPIGCLAGWTLLLFVIAQPIRRLGKLTFADALDARFNSRAVRLAAGSSTLLVCLLLVVPAVVAAGRILSPLLGLPAWAGALTVGLIVTLIVVTAGMVSATWVQFIKAVILVLFCAVLVRLVLQYGFVAQPPGAVRSADSFLSTNDFALDNPANKDRATPVALPPSWAGKPYAALPFRRRPRNDLPRPPL